MEESRVQQCAAARCDRGTESDAVKTLIEHVAAEEAAAPAHLRRKRRRKLRASKHPREPTAALLAWQAPDAAGTSPRALARAAAVRGVGERRDAEPEERAEEEEETPAPEPTLEAVEAAVARAEALPDAYVARRRVGAEHRTDAALGGGECGGHLPPGVCHPFSDGVTIEDLSEDLMTEELTEGSGDDQFRESDLATAGTADDEWSDDMSEFSEVLYITDNIRYRMWKDRRAAIAGLWQVYLFRRSGWRGPMNRQLPNRFFEYTARYFDPDIFTRRPWPIIEDSPLDTLRHLFRSSLY